MDIEKLKLRVALLKDRYEHTYVEYSELNDYLIKFFNYSLSVIDDTEKYFHLCTKYKQSIYLYIKYRKTGQKLFVEEISYRFNLSKDENYNSMCEKILIDNSYKNEFEVELTFEETLEFFSSQLKFVYKWEMINYPISKIKITCRKDMN